MLYVLQNHFHYRKSIRKTQLTWKYKWQKCYLGPGKNIVQKIKLKLFMRHSLIILLVIYFYLFLQVQCGCSDEVTAQKWMTSFGQNFDHYSIIFYSIIFLSMYCPSGESEDRWEALGKTINLDQPWATMEIIVRLSILCRGHTRSIGPMYRITYFREKMLLNVVTNFYFDVRVVFLT